MIPHFRPCRAEISPPWSRSCLSRRLRLSHQAIDIPDYSVNRVAGARSPTPFALARDEQVVGRNRDIADKSFRPEFDRDGAVERCADALEHDLTEAFPPRLLDRRAALLLPVEADAVSLLVARPGDRDLAPP